jgi:hypothetical protein
MYSCCWLLHCVSLALILLITLTGRCHMDDTPCHMDDTPWTQVTCASVLMRYVSTRCRILEQARDEAGLRHEGIDNDKRRLLRFEYVFLSFASFRLKSQRVSPCQSRHLPYARRPIVHILYLLSYVQVNSDHTRLKKYRIVLKRNGI